MADPEKWVDPLNGYAYDSFNRDALINLAKVEKGRVVMPGGASYGLLVVPGSMKMSPDGGERMSTEVAQKLLQLVKAGATIVLMEKPVSVPGKESEKNNDKKLKILTDELFTGEKTKVTDALGGQFISWRKGKGCIIQGPYHAVTFDQLGIQKDFVAADGVGKQAGYVAWNHRKDGQSDIYFVANQLEKQRTLELNFRIENKVPELYNPVTDETYPCHQWKTENGRTKLTYRFEANESLFVIFRDGKINPLEGVNWIEFSPEMTLSGAWNIQFDPKYGGPAELVTSGELTDWSNTLDERIRNYSGTAHYSKSFQRSKPLSEGQAVWLSLGLVAHIAEVKVNGKSCGICWTAPYRVRIDQALKQGENKLEILVTNTWANRIIGDHNLPEEKRITWTTAPYRLEGKPLLPAGLLGPVEIYTEKK